MEFSFSLLLQICAGLNFCAAFVLGLRALHSRAGTWAILLGVALGLAALTMSLLLKGHERLLPVWWFAWAIAPALWLPLGIAMANIGLLRQLLLFLNACLAILALGLSYWVYIELSPGAAQSLRIVQAAENAWYLLVWAGVLGLAALVDALLQSLRRGRPQQRQRVLLWLVVLFGLGLGWGIDGLSFSGYAVEPWGLPLQTLAFLVLTAELWQRPGPRRISGTITPALIQDTSQPLLIADGDGRIQAVNAAAVRLLDKRRHQVLGNEIGKVLGLEPDYLDVTTRMRGAGYVERIQIAVKAVKVVREVAVQPLVLRSAKGEVLALICTLNPGAEDPALAATSLQDPVTGLPGAALGEALVEQELRRHAGGGGPLVAAIYVRLDDTRTAASRHGRVLYERLQYAVVDRLKAVCDWPLDLARSAGGGYVMLLSQVNDREEVLEIARRAWEMLSRPYKLEGEQLDLPVYMTVLPDLRVYHDLVDVLADARHGLEQARHDSAQLFVVEERAAERVSLALSLEAAIANDALDLRLEPVVDLKQRKACGARALLTWQPQGMPQIGDEELRRLARRVHLEGQLNQWRLKQLSRFSLPQGWMIWIPVDAEELQSSAFVKAFPRALSRLPFQPMLEVTDAIWMLPSVHQQVANLVEAGLGLHAVEFAAGARLVTHAAGLQARSASLSAVLVQSHGPASDAMILGLVSSAQVLGARLRGDGVRKQADLKRLLSLGVDLASGEYFGSALKLSELEAWLQAEAPFKAQFAGVSASPTERRRPSLN